MQSLQLYNMQMAWAVFLPSPRQTLRSQYVISDCGWCRLVTGRYPRNASIRMGDDADVAVKIDLLSFSLSSCLSDLICRLHVLC